MSTDASFSEKENFMKFLKSAFLCFSFMVSLSFLTPESYGQSNKKITLSGTLGAQETFHGRWIILIYQEAFKRLAYELEYVEFKSKEASDKANSGQIDGEINRVPDYNLDYPNLIRVEEPHFSMSFCAYTTLPDITLNGWQSLKDTPYKVLYREGVKKCEIELPKLVSISNLDTVNFVFNGLKKIASKKSDIYIDIDSSIEEELNSDTFLESGIRKAGVMEEITAHAFLHKKYEALASQLSQTLKEMKQEGVIESLKITAGNQ